MQARCTDLGVAITVSYQHICKGLCTIHTCIHFKVEILDYSVDVSSEMVSIIFVS